MGAREEMEARLDYYRKHLFFSSHLRGRDYKCDPKLLDAVARYFEVDLSDPRQREWLLHVLIDVIFDRRKRGRPKHTRIAWNGTRRARLARLYEKIKGQHPKLSDAKIAELIHKHKEFKNDDPEQIRQRLRAVSREFAGIMVFKLRVIPDINKSPLYGY